MTRNHVAFSAFALVAVAACEEDELPSQYADENLEQATVVPDPEDPLLGNRRDAAGTLVGNLEGPDMEIRVGTATGIDVVTVHAPGRPDLSAWSGTEVLMSIVEVSSDGDIALLVVDANGDVLYLLEPIEPGDLTALVFGTGFIQRGGDLGPTVAFRGTMRLYDAVVTTDDGPVTLLPGAPQEIVVDGASYRIVLTASWHRDLESDAVLSCDIREDVLSFDLQRVDPGTANLSQLSRPEGLPIEHGDCGLPVTAP